MSRDSKAQPPTPTAPGWYPDPWSATGHGERYFDGKAWGRTDRPVGRAVGPLDDSDEPTRSRRRRLAGGSRRSPGRFRRNLLPFGLLAVTVGLVWGYGQYNRGDGESAPTASESTPPGNDAAGFATDRPPPSEEAESSPLGAPAPSVGTGGEFEFVAHQEDDPSTPVAFDPCRPIHYVIRADGAPPDGAQLTRESIEVISAATGLVFIDDGATNELPQRDREAYQPDRYDADRWAPVVIAWSDEGEEPELAGYIAGIGGAQPIQLASGALVYVTGHTLLDRFDLSPEVIPDRAIARATIIHELGHIVGLDHVADRSQIMFSETQPGVTELGDGDLAGLALLGTQGCYPEL